ncbi:MAG TPA: putative toxin-antitoxin system toxin component, PIN family [Candidatus Hodarchaeales archaeon]|nr:putative toxin-antitoxin system toxin component, PIN family [Candidatus Hodarchaeales archaeon]HLC85213.1 putative toxin-antitoxin system toxin component, PIN family [Candidatus Nanoarchaeia archaeon]
MRVVLDTNIFVSGIHWPGASAQVMSAWFDDQFILVSSYPLIKEFRRILGNFKKPLSVEDMEWWENLIYERADMVIPTRQIFAVKDDPYDDKFIEAAVEGKADYIVTQDGHLLALKQYGTCLIVNPEEFPKKIEK